MWLLSEVIIVYVLFCSSTSIIKVNLMCIVKILILQIKSDNIEKTFVFLPADWKIFLVLERNPRGLEVKLFPLYVSGKKYFDVIMANNGKYFPPGLEINMKVGMNRASFLLAGNQNKDCLNNIMFPTDWKSK